MQDFPGNSRKAKDRPEAPPPGERPKVEQITSASAKQRRRGLGRRFKETFIQGTARDTAEFMVADIVVPAVQDMLYDAFEGGLRRMILGESPRTRRGGGASSYSSPQPHVNYQGMSTSKPATQRPAERMLSRQSRDSHDFGDIIIDSRREADDVIEMMYEYLSRFGSVTVADLYTMTGIKTSHVDHTWGWTSLNGAGIVRWRDRFMLNLPEPQPLN